MLLIVLLFIIFREKNTDAWLLIIQQLKWTNQRGKLYMSKTCKIITKNGEKNFGKLDAFQNWDHREWKFLKRNYFMHQVCSRF